MVLARTIMCAKTPRKNNAERLPDDDQVEAPGDVLDILDVVFNPFLEIHAAAAGAADLPQAGDSGTDRQAQARAGVDNTDLSRCGLGREANDGHVAHQHVEELRQLVDVSFANKSAGGGEARILFDEKLWAVGLILGGQAAA